MGGTKPPLLSNFFSCQESKQRKIDKKVVLKNIYNFAMIVVDRDLNDCRYFKGAPRHLAECQLTEQQNLGLGERERDYLKHRVLQGSMKCSLKLTKDKLIESN